MSGGAILLAGTNTEVGKTAAGLLLARALARRGLKVAGFKPVESGCEPDPMDALAWAAVTGLELEQVCPYRLRLPVAPQSAAEAEGRRVELGPIRAGLDALRGSHDLVMVESAGGLGSPMAPDLLVLDLARRLDLPVLLVAPHALGSVGQVLVACRLLAHEGVRCLGVVLSQHTAAGPGPEARTHAPLLRQHGRGVPLLGILPFAGAAPPPAPPAPLLRWAERGAALATDALDLEPLLRTAG